MSKAKLLKFSTIMTVVAGIILLALPHIILTDNFLSPILDGSNITFLTIIIVLLFFSGIQYVLPILIAAFIFKFTTQKTQSNLCILLAILLEAAILYYTIIFVILSELINDYIAMALLLLPIIPVVVSLFCNVIALFMPKD